MSFGYLWWDWPEIEWFSLSRIYFTLSSVDCLYETWSIWWLFLTHTPDNMLLCGEWKVDCQIRIGACRGVLKDSRKWVILGFIWLSFSLWPSSWCRHLSVSKNEWVSCEIVNFCWIYIWRWVFHNPVWLLIDLEQVGNGWETTDFLNLVLKGLVIEFVLIDFKIISCFVVSIK